jgi:hypothetical protein
VPGTSSCASAGGPPLAAPNAFDTRFQRPRTHPLFYVARRLLSPSLRTKTDFNVHWPIEKMSLIAH